MERKAWRTTRSLASGVVWFALGLSAGCQRNELVSNQAPITGDDKAWCDALEVLRDECQECHAEGAENPAPMPLEAYADLTADAVSDPSKKVYELVGVRIHDKQRPMPEAPRKLSAAQLDALDAWIANGAKVGSDPTCTKASSGGDGDGDDQGEGDGDSQGVGDGDDDSDKGDGGTGSKGDSSTGSMAANEWPEDCEHFYTLRANDNGKPHTVAAKSETHPQFVFDAPWGDDKVQALAIRPLTDNKKVIHHWILYENSGVIGGQFLTSWAPGKEGMRKFPEDIGVYMPSGSKALRLDVHYYNLGGTQSEKDQSGVELCVTRTFRKHTATTYAFSASATAPPGEKTNTSTCTVSTTNGSAYLITSSPHMHKLGVAAKFARLRSGSEMVLDEGPFTVESQHVKTLDRVELKSGDRVSTSCSYENPTNSTVSFGQDTDDEMCFNFALYYPMGNLRCTGGTGLPL